MTDNKDITVPKRGRFVKGQSGNPGGRPAKLPELTASCAAMTTDVLRTIQGILLNDEAKDSDRIAASRLLLEYAYGKPSQALSLDVEARTLDVKLVGELADWAK